MSDVITPETLRSMLEKTAPEGEAGPLVLDVRTPEDYAAGHVPGAAHIPIDEVKNRLSEIPRDRLVISYCNMFHPGSSRGERAAALLREAGYNARALLGGYPAWRAAEDSDHG